MMNEVMYEDADISDFISCAYCNTTIWLDEECECLEATLRREINRQELRYRALVDVCFRVLRQHTEGSTSLTALEKVVNNQ
jgi:hypothetical protein